MLLLSLVASDGLRASAELTRADLDAWLDGLVPAALHAGDIAGGVVVVVRDGDVLTERGYGYADVAARRPVDPKTTLFRPGSISKLFTWTAVMQLVEQGKLDLDADISRYLDFAIPPRADGPITLRMIMTHTSGFEESIKNVTGPRPAPPLGAILKNWVPKRIFAAGTVPAYSNYASALAGYIVERVSGEPFDLYMDRHVFAPLGMSRSTFRQPVPEHLRPFLSHGYLLASEPARYFEYLGPGPAGAMSGTGDDMARFMIAHLQGGRYADTRILSAATTVAMHALQPRHYPALNGMALGFYEHSRNGHRVLAHNGGTQFFHSDLHLFIDDGVGIYISLNSPGKADAATELHDAVFTGFADRYFTATTAQTPAAVESATARAHARLMAGPWEHSRRSESSVLKLFGLLSTITIQANSDGSISFPLPRHGTLRWREIAPFVWRETDGQQRIQALLVNGRPVMLGLDLAPPAALLPVPAWRSPTWLIPALGAALTIVLLNGLSWPIAALARRHFGVPAHRDALRVRQQRLSRALALTTSLSMLAVLTTLIYMASSFDRLADTMDPWLVPLRFCATLSALLGSCAAIHAAIALWPSRSRLARLRSALLAASCLFLFSIAVAFHFAGLGRNY